MSIYLVISQNHMLSYLAFASTSAFVAENVADALGTGRTRAEEHEELAHERCDELRLQREQVGREAGKEGREAGRLGGEVDERAEAHDAVRADAHQIVARRIEIARLDESHRKVVAKVVPHAQVAHPLDSAAALLAALEVHVVPHGVHEREPKVAAKRQRVGEQKSAQCT